MILQPVVILLAYYDVGVGRKMDTYCHTDAIQNSVKIIAPPQPHDQFTYDVVGSEGND